MIASDFVFAVNTTKGRLYELTSSAVLVQNVGDNVKVLEKSKVCDSVSVRVIL